MKLALVTLTCMVACAHAQFNQASAFAGFGAPKNQNKPQFYKQPQPFRGFTTQPPLPVAPVIQYSPVRVSTSDAAANTVKFGNDISPDGSYNYFYETDNGIAAQEQGSPRNLGGNPPVVANVVQGGYSWTSPEGKAISISYVADENGYQPQGDAIPQPPPIPPQIARAIEYILKSKKA